MKKRIKIILYCILLILSGCRKESKVYCNKIEPPDDPATFNSTHQTRATAFVDSLWTGSVYSIADTMFITLIEKTKAPDSVSYRKCLDTTSGNIFQYSFEKDRYNPARWQQLKFKFDILFEHFPFRDTALTFVYLLNNGQLFKFH